MADCGRPGWWRCCQFEPRYDEQPVKRHFEGKVTFEELRDLLVIRRYVRDVCVRCGKTIERAEEKTDD